MWTNSTEHPPEMASVLAERSKCLLLLAPLDAYAEQIVSAGRSRFPPAATKCPATSARNGSEWATEERRASSTRMRSAGSSGRPSASSGDMFVQATAPGGVSPTGLGNKSARCDVLPTSKECTHLECAPQGRALLADRMRVRCNTRGSLEKQETRECPQECHHQLEQASKPAR